jgi:hypothetical protein
MKALKLISLYYYLCKHYKAELSIYCQHFSNNSKPSNEKITDEELLAIYFYSRICENKHTKKAIYDYAVEYLGSWFPKLPTYKNFNCRINSLNSAITALVQLILEDIKCSETFDNEIVNWDTSLMDSMPIILCSGKRDAQVIPAFSDKTFSGSKNIWYYGVKLHCIAFKRYKKLPFPEYLTLTPASHNDLSAVKDILLQTPNRTFIGDKAYKNAQLEKELADIESFIRTPVKKKQGKSEQEQQFDYAADNAYSAIVSADRQPIESFFASLIHKTNIQRASMVRSYTGLLVHVFAALAAYLLDWLFV